ncbi:MAG: RluA family pseudouridine synthase [Alphaproteobacteria bacterium]|nr:MAG: RluA family pseudouridine synthase [Alphaproteobacteria bacterium]
MTIDLTDRILYRDGWIVAIDKPAGLPVHAGPSGRPSLEDFRDQLRFGLPRLPELAHRLDADTSGCLVLGRHRRALRRLGRLFREGQVRKTYHAIVHGIPQERGGEITLPLKKISSREKGWRIVVAEDGKPAHTRWKMLAEHPEKRLALLALEPLTGRTHQLRVHLAAIGHPILGDVKYAEPEIRRLAPRLMLHASRLVLPLYENKPRLVITAPLPEIFSTLIEGRCRP